MSTSTRNRGDVVADVTFTEGVRTAQPLSVGITGPAGAGKTYSALRIAYGLADGGPIAVIDTENRRALQYAGRFPYRFLHANLTAPFTPERYLFTIQKAVNAGARVIIIDSMSHEWEGEGGCLEWHEAELDRMAGDDWAKRERSTWTAWIKPKAAHNRLVNYLEQLPCHIIICSRAKDKIDLKAKDANGKVKPAPMGWTPIVGERLAYFATLSIVLPPGAKGAPALDEKSTKLDMQAFGFIRDQQQLSEATGAALLAWSKGEDLTKAGGTTRRDGQSRRAQGDGEGGSTAANAEGAGDDDAALIFNDAPTEDKHILGLRKLVAMLDAVKSLPEYTAIVDEPERKKYLLQLQKSNRANLYAAIAPRITDAYMRASKNIPLNGK